MIVDLLIGIAAKTFVIRIGDVLCSCGWSTWLYDGPPETVEEKKKVGCAIVQHYYLVLFGVILILFLTHT